MTDDDVFIDEQNNGERNGYGIAIFESHEKAQQAKADL